MDAKVSTKTKTKTFQNLNKNSPSIIGKKVKIRKNSKKCIESADELDHIYYMGRL